MKKTQNILNYFLKYLSSIGLSKILIFLIIPVTIVMNYDHHKWVNPEKVIQWDVKSYYAYLPATFIHKDLYLKFIDKDYKKHIKMFWPSKSPTGKRLIITTMGLSFLYLPFFLMAHIVALNTQFPADGVSVPYAYALVFSSLFYLILGLFYLRKILLLYFNEIVTAFTLFLIYFGTNLLFYTVYNSAMPHTYNFALLTIFTWNVIQWFEKQTVIRTIILGLLLGLITLIRPTNILIVLILIFYNIKSFKEIRLRVLLFLKNWNLIFLMIAMFIMVWVPQFIYWKLIAGKFLFFSYGEDSNFFWNNPQFYNVLFSFRKGWYIYTPIMIFASLGVFFMIKNNKVFFWSVMIFLLSFIYIQSTWWCWWFGGSFGMRSFVDIYGLMGIPLASFIYFALMKKNKIVHYFFSFLLIILTIYNLHMTRKYLNSSVHYWWMSKTAYFSNFFNYSPNKEYWNQIPVPDYEKARKGLYVSKNLIKRYYGQYPISPEMIVEKIKQEINDNGKMSDCNWMVNRFGISLDSAITIKAWNIYEQKLNLNKYFVPLENEYVTKLKYDK